MLKINGKYYPLWSQFIERKNEWMGGILEDHDMGEVHETIITDITLKPNGDVSAFFSVVGEDFLCGFDTEVGGITSGEESWITFSGYGGHVWRIKPK